MKIVKNDENEGGVKKVSPSGTKQSIWRGCPEATDAPDTICRPKMIKKVVSRLYKSSEKTNARRRIMHFCGSKKSSKTDAM